MRHRLVARRLLAGLFALGVLASGLAGCRSSPRPERQVEVSNAGFQLEQLFTDERGYTVYRFYDKGAWHYYVISPEGEAQTLPSTRQRPNAAVGVGAGVGMGSGVGVGGAIRPR